MIERETRTLEEITRAAHLCAGFHMMLDLWQHSVQYAATVINAYHPIKDKDGNSFNRHELASEKAFDGRQLILGELIYVRKDPLNRRSLKPMLRRHSLLDGGMIADQSFTKGFIRQSIMQQRSRRSQDML